MVFVLWMTAAGEVLNRPLSKFKLKVPVDQKKAEVGSTMKVIFTILLFSRQMFKEVVCLPNWTPP